MISFSNIQYIPILALKPAEMAALEELPNKDKDFLLPLISLKKWVNSKSLDKSFERINKAIQERPRIIDLDKSYVSKCTNENSTPVNNDILKLADSKGGYKNWVNLFKENDNFIPVIQLQNLRELDAQLDNFIDLSKSIVIRLEMQGKYRICTDDFQLVMSTLLPKQHLFTEILFLFDYGDFERNNLLNYNEYSDLVIQLNQLFPNTFFSISGTSFPYSFRGSYRGEIPIYERQIFNKVKNECTDIQLIYSDRASTRSEEMGGGGGVPPPRIDYPLKNDWRFIRKEFITGDDSEKLRLYQEAALEVIGSEFWIDDLYLWGTQMIEKTSLGDPYAITSANRATAVRINIHLYQQLHYYSDFSNLDTDDDWED